MPITLTLEEMILVCIDSVLKNKQKCSFGDLVKECFQKYPKYFCLNDVPEYPDSLKLDRPLREMRQKGAISGSPTTYYSVTNLGLSYLSNLKKLNACQSDKAGLTTRSPVLQTTEKLRNSEDFARFLKKGSAYKPDDMRLRSILGFTLETPVYKINHELDFLLASAEKFGKPDVVDYIKRYKAFFRSKR